MRSVLIYRRGGLGDTLLVFPLLEIFNKKGYRVVAVGNTDYYRLAEEVGWADLVLSELPPWDGERVIISYEGNVKPFPEKRIWIVQHYLESLGLKEDFSQELPIQASKGGPLEGVAVLHPSSGSWKKNPKLELFLSVEEVLKRKGYKVVYFVGEADQWLKGYVSNFWESLNLVEIAKALKAAKLFVGLDSGISHLSAYLGVPTFIFYGPTDPIVWRPIGKRVFQISLNLECSPCFPNVCEARECLDVNMLLDRFLYYFNSYTF
ncbi:glycosyltransferase family 9 protein [Thermocrinis minervae]|uniref:ADP-heptose:LPS heptosyltransferase n=1 Tax=Thermocrinis minervae TaxID=381751 RepID=A0A1M6TKY6_9AQUI|nr:glycosyltransferase family 9 protein [Thermocrinis minervae]SHK57549.1 ADP-heptose:LPS heptosyltransferase [Thermocrinis minervae]